jgi:predicted ATPase
MLIGNFYDESQTLQRDLEANDDSTIFYLSSYKLTLCYLFEQHKADLPPIYNCENLLRTLLMTTSALIGLELTHTYITLQQMVLPKKSKLDAIVG